MNPYLILQARAAREFGIPWEVFDTLTPSELAAIAQDCQKSWVAEQKLKDARAARITAAIYRSFGQKVKEKDFMPEYETKTEDRRVQSDDEIRSRLMAIALFMKS